VLADVHRKARRVREARYEKAVTRSAALNQENGAMRTENTCGTCRSQGSHIEQGSGGQKGHGYGPAALGRMQVPREACSNAHEGHLRMAVGGIPGPRQPPNARASAAGRPPDISVAHDARTGDGAARPDHCKR
jgi:hypothetical protein